MLTLCNIDSTLCLPVMVYGSELWSLTNTELNILEHTHCKILHTIQRPSNQMPNNSPPVPNWLSSFIFQRQLAPIYSITNMQSSDLPKQVVEVRIIYCKPHCEGNHC